MWAPWPAFTPGSMSHQPKPNHTMLTSFERGVSKEWVDFHQMAPSLYKEDGPLSETVKSLKSKAVQEAVEAHNWNSVKEYCRTLDGLVSNGLRKKVWPALLGALDVSLHLHTLDQLNTNDLQEHKDEDQVLLDVKRLFTVTCMAPQGTEDLEELRRRLFGLVVRVLRKYPQLNYYQGFHDIASVVLLVCYENDRFDETTATVILERLTVLHLRDFMLPNIDLTVNHLKVVAALLEETDPVLFQIASVSSQLFQITNGLYYDYKFIEPLLLILTIFSHDITDAALLLPVWDFVLSYNSVAASLYIYAAALIQFKKDIMTKLDLDDDTNAMYLIDPAQAHAALSASNLFTDISAEDLLRILGRARKLIEKHPMLGWSNKEKTIDSWFARFNKDSVLVTSSSLESQQIMEHLFDADKLGKILRLQHEQQQAESKHASDILADEIEQSALTDSIASTDDDINSTRMNLLSSSLSSLSAASNSLNNTLVNKSSMLFKKMFSHSSDSINDESTVAKRSKKRALSLNIYKISVSVGFVGFLIHCLLRHSEITLRNYPLGPFGLFNSISASVESFLPDTIATVRHGFREVAGGITSKFGEALNAGIDVTHIGIGTLRDSIYIVRR